ncbi:MAG TPA: hypothetical protein VED40_10545 [Azospirillaceae bacterium]|nr:hypothetical protein [Azospirillaceae bacterium]
MADPRDELLRQMRAIRERLDPDLLERAGQAAEAIQSGKAKPAPEPEPEMVPYDKEAARAAVMSFLQARHDGGQFAQKLMEAMKRGDDAQRAYGGAAPKPGGVTRKA